MEVKLEGRDKLVKPLQPAKASCSMEVKLEGRDKLVKPLQFKKAQEPNSLSFV